MAADVLLLWFHRLLYVGETWECRVVSTTTTILPVNAVCDPHNDHCELAKGLCCDLDAYQCRYTDDGARCIGDMTTASMTTVTTRTKPAIPTATKTKTTRATTAAVATKTETAPKGSTATATTRILPIPPTLHPAANHRLPVYAYGAFGGSVLVLILGVSTACYCLQKQKLWRLKLRYGNDTNDDDDDDDDVQLLNLEASLAQATAPSQTTAAAAAVFAVAELTTFGHQIALAMSFLEHHKLLHRDLAARNVLLTEQMLCKLADFGLSRTVGHRLKQPELCPDAVYTMMLACWAAEPESRPPFAQVAGQLYSTLAANVV
eukprot:gene15873-21271_t